QDYLFEDLVDKLFEKHPENRSPLVEAVLVFQNAAAGPTTRENNTGTPAPGENAHNQNRENPLKPYESPIKTAKFDLSFYCSEVGEELFVIAEYSSTLFKKETMEIIVDHFKELLSIVGTSKNILLKEITLSQEKAEADTTVRQFDFEF
ncbi:MAG: hypothetical protein GY757_07030, partial [bacterium]|nr:hypothetical protein [bacterium]